MMKDRFAELEHRRLTTLAREYRNLGYTVIIKPAKEQLPPFLASFKPDMIAKNDQENIVFLVRSRKTLSTSPELTEIAKAVEGKKDWRLDLVVTNPREKDGFKTASQQLLNRNEVMTRLQDSQHLTEQEHGEAAFLLTWSATEALLRSLAAKELTAKEKLSPMQSSSEAIAKNLFVYGFLDREQYETLLDGVKVRNSIMHGYQDPPAYGSLLNKLQHFTQQLLNEEQPVAVY